MAAQGIRFLLQMVSTILLARLLSPDDYGIVAMVLAITGLVGMFKTMGLSTATIQRANVNHAQISTLFWINLAIGFLIMILVACLAPVIGWFYSDTRLIWLTIVLSSTFLFSGLTVQHEALLRRQMQFAEVACIQISSMFLSIITGIIFAWYGFGYWALVGMRISESAANSIGVWLFCRWRPGLPTRGAGVRGMLAFGGHLVGFSTINYFARNMDNVLIGRFVGSASLGLYSKACQLMMIPISQLRGPLASVSLPAMSSLQDQPEQFCGYYKKMISILSFISMPLVVFLFVYSDDLIFLLLGKKWLGASIIFKVLAATAFIQPVYNTVGLVLVSLGQAKRQLKWGVYHSIVIVSAFLLGISRGAIGVAYAYSIVNYIILFPTLWYAFKFTPVSISNFCSAIWRQVITSLFMGVVIFASRCYFVNQPKILSIVISLLIGMPVYFFLWLLMPRGKETLGFYKSYLLILISKSRRVRSPK